MIMVVDCYFVVLPWPWLTLEQTGSLWCAVSSSLLFCIGYNNMPWHPVEVFLEHISHLPNVTPFFLLGSSSLSMSASSSESESGLHSTFTSSNAWLCPEYLEGFFPLTTKVTVGPYTAYRPVLVASYPARYGHKNSWLCDPVPPDRISLPSPSSWMEPVGKPI